MSTSAERIESKDERSRKRGRSGGGRGRAVWRDHGRGGLWWGGLRWEGEGEAAAVLSLSSGGGEGRYWSVLQLHWLPSPTLPKEPEQCWQICPHVFIIIKNVKDPSSLEAQQIPLITFLSPLSSAEHFAFSHSFHPTPPTPRSVWRVGGPFPFLLGAWWLPGGF